MTATLNINFLASKQEQFRRQAKRLLLIQTTSLVILIVYLIVVGSIGGYYFYLRSQTMAMDRKYNTLTGEVQALASREAKEVFIKSKVESLVPILSSQRKNQDLVEAIFSILPQGVAVSGFGVSEDGKINFTANATSFSALKIFMSNLEKKQITPTVNLEFARINSVGLTNDGGYFFDIILDLETK